MKILNNPLQPTHPGICRYCRCTYMNACAEGCGWADRQQTVCDSQECLMRFAAALIKHVKKFAKAELA